MKNQKYFLNRKDINPAFAHAKGTHWFFNKKKNTVMRVGARSGLNHIFYIDTGRWGEPRHNVITKKGNLILEDEDFEYVSPEEGEYLVSTEYKERKENGL